MLKNNTSRYGLIAKLFHWVTFIFLIVQIPFGVYISNLEFSSTKITLENYHILSGVIIFYIILARII
jgi:cytochrome b561